MTGNEGPSTPGRRQERVRASLGGVSHVGVFPWDVVGSDVTVALLVSVRVLSGTVRLVFSYILDPSCLVRPVEGYYDSRTF